MIPLFQSNSSNAPGIPETAVNSSSPLPPHRCPPAPIVPRLFGILAFNIGRKGGRQTCFGPRFNKAYHALRGIVPPPDEELPLEGFIQTLESIRDAEYILQGATFSPIVAYVFIDTQDEQWPSSVGCMI